MAILELSAPQLAALKAGWKQLKLCIDGDTEISDEIASDLGMSAESRGLENEDGEADDDYDEGQDPVFQVLGEVALLIETAK